MLKGTLDDFTLADIFRLLSSNHRTGSLQIERRAGNGRVFFRSGEVYYAESSLSREPLGQKLIRAGQLTEGALRRALDEHAANGKRVGAILVERGDITEDALQTAVQAQIEDAVFDLLSWEVGDFAWEPDYEITVEMPIYVSVENLIMEASRRLDEFDVIRRKIKGLDVVPMMAATPPDGAREINITPEEWRLLVMVDGIRSIGNIAQTAGVEGFTAMRTLYGLVSAGLVEVPGEDLSQPDAAQGQQVVPPGQRAAFRAETAQQPAAQQAPQPQRYEPAPQPQPQYEQPAPRAQAPMLQPDPVVEQQLYQAPQPAPEAAPYQEPSPQPVVEPDRTPESALGGSELEIDPRRSGAEPTLEVPPPAPNVTPESTEVWSPQPPPADPVYETPPSPASFDEPIIEPAAPAPEGEAQAPLAPADDPQVDRTAVVRELAGLFDDDTRPRLRRTEGQGAEGAEAGAAPSEGLRRVEDDDQVTRSLISRLIDGVKGV